MFYLLQAGSQTSNATTYLPLALQILIAVGLVVFLLVLTHLLGPSRKTSDKLQNFTSGIESHGDARQTVAIKYFLTAILFVLFDIEVVFMYPWAVNFRALGLLGVIEVFSFILLLLIGFYYMLAKNALKWED